MKKRLRKTGMIAFSLILLSVQALFVGSAAAQDPELSATLTASSYHSSGYEAAKANDNNYSTWWSANDNHVTSNPSWLMADLGGYYDITGTEVVFKWTGKQRFNIEMSRDGVNWGAVKQRHTGTEEGVSTPLVPTGEKYADTFDVKHIRYVRLYFPYTTSQIPVPSGQNHPEAVEFKIFGKTTSGDPGTSLLDTTAPAAINDLAAGDETIDSLTLSWTAPKEDGATGGGVLSYEVRMSDSGPINTEAAWNSANILKTIWITKDSGMTESLTVENLDPSTTYYFAIKSKDEAGNVSGLSNSASGTTLAADVTPPTVITDLAVKSGSVNQTGLVLQWTTPSDNSGQKELRYEIFMSEVGPINESNVNNPAHTVKREFAPVTVYQPDGTIKTQFGFEYPIVNGSTLGIGAAGSPEEWLINPLMPNKTYYFAVRTVDKSGNASALSNSVSATTPDIDPDEVIVTNMFELKAAIDSAPPTGRTIWIASPQDAADGIPGNTTAGYPHVLQQDGAGWCPGCNPPRSGEIHIENKQYLTIRGATGNRDDVIIQGDGMGLSGQPYTNVEINFRIKGSDFITFKDLTVQKARAHNFQLVTHNGNGSDYFHVDNVKMWDAGEGPLKGTTPFTPNGPYQDYGLIENSLIGFSPETALSPRTYGFSFGLEPVSFKDWIVRNNRFENVRHPNENASGAYAVYTKGASVNFIVENNEFYNSHIPISYGNGGNTPHHYKRGWISYVTGNDAESYGGVIRNNVIYGAVDAPINLTKALDVKVLNNTIWGDPNFSLGSIDVRFGVSSGEIRNNLMNAGITYRNNASASNFTSDGNLTNQSGSESSLFVNVSNGSGAVPASGGNFHLKEGSAAIDAGVNVGSWVPTDKDGNARPANGVYDVGAYEYGGEPPAQTVPNAPTGLAASGGDGEVVLSWNASAGADSYNVYRSTSPGGPYGLAIASGITAAGYVDTNVTNGVTYYYVVTAENVAGESSPSAEASATPQASGGGGTVYQASAGFSDTQGANQWYYQHNLDYNDYTAVNRTYNWANMTYNSGLNRWERSGGYPAITATGYHAGYYEAARVWEAPDDGTISITGTASGAGGSSDGVQILVLHDSALDGLVELVGPQHVNNTQDYAVNVSGITVTQGDRIYFVVNKRVNSTADNPTWDPVITFYGNAAPPAAPGNVGALAGDGSVTVSWGAVTGADSYNVYRSTSPGGPYGSAIATGVTATQYTDTNVSNGTTYYYVVKAVNAAGEGAASAEVSAQPQSSGGSGIQYLASAGFSSTQGANQWYYQYWNGSSYVNMGYYDAGSGHWEISDGAAAPYIYAGGITAGYWEAALVWEAPGAGTVNITSNVSKKDGVKNGSGVIARIVHNANELANEALAGDDDLIGIDMNINQLSVAQGDKIYFLIDKGINSTGDAIDWDPLIEFIP
jgi:hypothetical protein